MVDEVKVTEFSKSVISRCNDEPLDTHDAEPKTGFPDDMQTSGPCGYLSNAKYSR